MELGLGLEKDPGLEQGLGVGVGLDPGLELLLRVWVWRWASLVCLWHWLSLVLVGYLRDMDFSGCTTCMSAILGV